MQKLKKHYTTLWKEFQHKFQHVLGQENACLQGLKGYTEKMTPGKRTSQK